VVAVGAPYIEGHLKADDEDALRLELASAVAQGAMGALVLQITNCPTLSNLCVTAVLNEGHNEATTQCHKSPCSGFPCSGPNLVGSKNCPPAGNNEHVSAELFYQLAHQLLANCNPNSPAYQGWNTRAMTHPRSSKSGHDEIDCYAKQTTGGLSSKRSGTAAVGAVSGAERRRL
jgi:hypothetical protein